MVFSFMGGAHSNAHVMSTSTLGLTNGGSKIDPTNTINFV